MPTPKVSVVMSAYNDEKYIREAVDSILNQTFSDFEFIIINDCSTDGTADILKSYKDDRIILLHNEVNIGLTRSLNKGLDIARGEYIARADSDDIFFPDRLEKQVRFLDENPNIGFISSSAILIDKDGKEIGQSILPTEDGELRSRMSKGKGSTFWHTSNMIRHDCIKKFGGYREWFRYAQDYDLWLRILEHYDASNIAEPLCKVRIVSGSISTGKELEQKIYHEFASLFAEQRRLYGKDDLGVFSGNPVPTRKSSSKVYLNMSKQYHDKDIKWNPRLSARFLFKSFINNPLNMDTWNYGISLAKNKAKSLFLKEASISTDNK